MVHPVSQYIGVTPRGQKLSKTLKMTFNVTKISSNVKKLDKMFH